MLLRVRHWSADDLGRLGVVPAEFVGLRPLQPTAGQFERVGDQVCFRPRFPLVPGARYALLVDGAPAATLTWPEDTSGGETSVVAIYPTARELPVNQLKLYIQFSGPMSEGWANRAVHVCHADDGEVLQGVFLPMEPELWDLARRRLTLLFDPGRIKRGLAPHAEVGYPLEQGVPIIVAIDRSFRDASGQPLRAGAERRYAVGPAVRRHVDPSAWHLRCPPAGTRGRLEVVFDRPLDRALLQHCLVVLDLGGRPVEGHATIAEGDRAWRFSPRRRWRPELYCLSVDPRLEDLAGNSLARVFDRDLTRPEDAPVEGGRADLMFRPR
jgi:hypothetical protein